MIAGFFAFLVIFFLMTFIDNDMKGLLLASSSYARALFFKTKIVVHHNIIT